MAASGGIALLLRFLLVAALILSPSLLLSVPSTSTAAAAVSAQVKGCPFNSIYSFGDGDSSTSNGLPFTDQLASALHTPSPNQYRKQEMEKKEDAAATAKNYFSHGATFSAAGSIVMPIQDELFQPPLPPASITVEAQVISFVEHLRSFVCPPGVEDCKKALQNSLFVIDQLGSNDYKYAFVNGKKSIQEVSNYVRLLNGVISGNVVRPLIMSGASHVFVTGLPPIGCFPGYLSLFRSSKDGHHDAHHCHEGLNAMARFHNEELRKELGFLRHEFPRVQIVYGDYYKAFMALLRNHDILGFKKGSLLKACCGFGGPYNFHPQKMCGNRGVRVCSDPTSYIHWDGFHLTEEATSNIVEAFLSGTGFVDPVFNFPNVTHCLM